MYHCFDKLKRLFGRRAVDTVNQHSAILNSFASGDGIRIDKPDSPNVDNPVKWSIDLDDLRKLLDKAEGTEEGSAATFDDHTDTGTNDNDNGTTWIWSAGGANGIIVDCYFIVAKVGSYHHLQRARMTYSKSGALVSAEGLSGMKVVKA